MMERNLFGFIIDNDIQLDIANKRLVRINSLSPEKLVLFSAVTLNDAMVRLLVFLLIQYGKGRQLSKNEILKKVWDENHYSSSSQKLWQTIKELRIRLDAIGLPHDFIVNVRGSGYTLNNPIVIPLFYE
ncbi:winged helix-turn-helix domain-containing protein [Serratia marcescens]|uniref:winged helix-turn-helix domain-containing protein n=1 Tax=Serratia TaxID=613 RepID=UPI0011D59F88|nr:MULTISPECIES: helix-turn-helix domain-containing protein [Serratia]MBH2775100.1 winged helix-turn-helix domain-containing protein [Serratia marcescens]MEB6084138.1 helix-turn-helix domain-containing protein [Serratia marcescens]TXE54729.1 winged helix-turn-helix domain-containing protein [Serratia nematodiphila]HCD1616884.1 winged helix-turn-helix domain-containing protein [Serratia marcescens]